jgi:hypothetical protein
VTVPFAVQKHFNLMQSHLPILSLNCWAIEVRFIKLLPKPIWPSVFPILSWGKFTVSDLTLRSLIYFELTTSTRWETLIWFHSFIDGYQFSQYHLLKRLFSPTHILGTFVKNQMAVAAWICVWFFCSFPLVFMSVFVLDPWYFYYYCSVV